MARRKPKVVTAPRRVARIQELADAIVDERAKLEAQISHEVGLQMKLNQVQMVISETRSRLNKLNREMDKQTS
jgi:hypothetical protein